VTEHEHEFEPTGELALARRGLAALELLNSLPDETTGRHLDDTQRQTLAGWGGWGPLAKALDYAEPNESPGWGEVRRRVQELLSWQARETARDTCDTAFYTPAAVRRGMWDLVQSLGFDGDGKVLEPGCGRGAFISAAPENWKGLEWTGVEADRTSAQIAGLLHPDAQIIAKRLEKTPLRQNGYDLAIGNVPFSAQGVYDPNAPKAITSLHGYFLWRALNAVRPGGLCVFVTSRWILDAEGTETRDELARLGVFLGAIRLPGSALAPGGTRAVTDIIVFRRRIGTAERHLDDRWLPPATAPEGLDTTVSQYFQGNPHLVLGAMGNRGGKRYGMTLDVRLPDGEDLAVRLDSAVSALAGQITAAGLGWQERATAPGAADGPGPDPDIDPAADGAYTLHGDGTITQQRDGAHHPVQADPELAALCRLKVAAVKLFAAEADETVGNNERERIRQAAFRAYQEYIAQFGYLSASELTTSPDPDDPDAVITVRTRPSRARKMFGQDPDWFTLLAVEEWNDDTQTGRPAMILTRRVGARAKRKEHTGDPGEALALTLDECGQADLAVTARILGVDEAEVPGLLGDAIWQDPATPGVWVTADEYLSGNVRVKLDQARAAHAADEIAGWARNVAALEAVQPEDLGPEQISVQLGAPWIPPETIHAFTCALLGVTGPYETGQVEVRYEKYTATWEVRASTQVRRRPEANLTWGTTRVNAVNLIEDACNNTTPTVYDKVDEGGKEKSVKNQVETALAADKIRDLHEKFAEWWAEDPKRADALCRLYNDRFNAVRVRTFDGSLLSFPGLAAWINPYQSQRDMIWRNVCTGTTLCGHVVGGGKTFIAVGTAMTLRRLGLVRKPAMVVPNHLLEQTCAEARRYYPGAKILMVTKEDLNPQRRKYFAARCAARDWDLVVLTIQQFGSLPVHPQIQEEYYCALLDELDTAMEDAPESRATAKMLARKRRKLIARLDELGDAAKDGGLTFGETGIDYLICDEAHWAKNLSFVCRAEGFNTDGSKRADDLLMKLTWLRKQSPDGYAAMLMTGTPVSNSLAELHTLFRYCAPELLAEQELVSFDSFAAQYIRYSTSTEVAPDGGGFRSFRRPRSFVNLPEVRAQMWRFADIRTRDDLDLNGPAVTVDHVVVEGPPELKPFTDVLVARADAIRAGKVKPHEDNMLLVCGAGRAAALWMPLVGIQPTGPGKIERCAAQVAKIYHDTKEQLYPPAAGTAEAGLHLFDPKPGALQVVFCDMGTPGKDGDGVYGYLTALLVHAGVPRGRIAWIHDSRSHSSRKELFARCRNGDVSVIIGSTEKMGTGVNIQRRMCAIHHLDAPWRPADVEQRDGRGDRPGNDHGTLLVYRYATKGSFDAYMWQALERKKRFIDQILCGDPHVREVEAVDNPQVLSYGQLKALATGQPLLMMLSEVQSEIARLRNSSAGHKRAQTRMAMEQRDEKANAARWGQYAELLGDVARRATPEAAAQFPGYDTCATGEDIAATLAEVLTSARRNRAKDLWFEYRRVYVTIEIGYRKTGAPVLTGVLAPRYYGREKGWTFSLGGGWKKMGESDLAGPARLLEQIDAIIAEAAAKASELTGRKAACLARAWDGQAQLAEALKRRAQIEADIDSQVADSRKPEPQPV
jgi:N12 class adenine-specific DNA methylase